MVLRDQKCDIIVFVILEGVESLLWESAGIMCEPGVLYWLGSHTNITWFTDQTWHWSMIDDLDSCSNRVNKCGITARLYESLHLVLDNRRKFNVILRVRRHAVIMACVQCRLRRDVCCYRYTRHTTADDQPTHLLLLHIQLYHPCPCMF